MTNTDISERARTAAAPPRRKRQASIVAMHHRPVPRLPKTERPLIPLPDTNIGGAHFWSRPRVELYKAALLGIEPPTSEPGKIELVSVRTLAHEVDRSQKWVKREIARSRKAAEAEAISASEAAPEPIKRRPSKRSQLEAV